MKYILASDDPADIRAEGFFEQEEPVIPNLFSGKEEELCFLPSADKGQAHRLLTGLGKEADLTKETIRKAYAASIKKARECKAGSISIGRPETDRLDEASILKALAEGLDLADYSFDKYKTDNTKAKQELTVLLPGFGNTEENRRILDETKNLAKAIKTARDMIAEPTNRLYPAEFARRAEEIAGQLGFEIDIMDEDRVKELGMDAFLAVAKGSANPLKFIVMRYVNSDSDEIWGLVGKGLTCDTGGYSLKSSESLMYMKSDMSGAANMLAVISAVAANRCKTNVVAVTAVCENVISGGSYKPGDVVGSMAGKNIEVLNTDAEGRLTLADALYYITEKEKVTKVIDMATLTGVAGTTFGNIYTPVVSNNREFLGCFMKAAGEADELFWEMPFDKRYRKMIDSQIADIKNTGGAGTITAAMFLQEFVQDIPWIHLDIAATAVLDPSPAAYIPNGPSGVAVRTLYELVKEGGRR